MQAPANAKVYANKSMGVQGTGGSSAIANSWDQLRTAGAAARAMFVAGGRDALRRRRSASWPSRTASSRHASSGKSARAFADLLADAAKVEPPQSPTLKDPKEFTLIGTDRVRRKDSAAKSTGAARYTQDVHLPNMLTAMVAHSPRFGGKVKSFDASAARKVAGRGRRVPDPHRRRRGGGQNTWAARQGRDALKVEWDDAKAETRGSDTLLPRYAGRRRRPETAPGVKWQAFATRGRRRRPPRRRPISRRPTTSRSSPTRRWSR